MRVEVDDSDDRMQKKIRNAQLQKVPFMLIAGDDDVEAGAVSFRYRDGTQDNGVPVDEAIERIVDGRRARAPGDRQRDEPMAELDAPGRRRGMPDRPRTRLWTPHRMAYIQGRASRPTTRAGVPVLPDPDAWTTRRRSSCTAASTAYAVLNLYPYNPGHLMVCPYRHVADYTDLDARRRSPRSPSLTQQAMRVRPRGLAARTGFNIGMNQGAIAGAGIAAHLHQHVVPRWAGDQNFMPIIGRTRAHAAAAHRHPRPARRRLASLTLG